MKSVTVELPRKTSSSATESLAGLWTPMVCYYLWPDFLYDIITTRIQETYTKLYRMKEIFISQFKGQLF